MGFTLVDMIKGLKPLKKSQKENLLMIKDCLDSKEYKLLKKLIKSGKVVIDFYNVKIDGLIKKFYPKLMVLTKDKDIINFCDSIYIKIDEKNRNNQYRVFSKNAHKIIPKYIAPKIVDMLEVKQSVMLMISSKDPIHILLLGDPGTGKTEILRSCVNLSRIGQYGLGSGISGAGLSVSFRGDQMIKGLLPLADGGVCAIDELNLMKDDDRASLYNAMEKGFITYNKANKHINLPTRVKVIATANPKSDSFNFNVKGSNNSNVLKVSSKILKENIKKQLPFDSALLSRFHLVFFIKKHTADEFKKISKSIVENHEFKVSNEIMEFIKDYLEYVSENKVNLPKYIEEMIVNYVSKLKENEDNYIIDITPRLVVGIVRMVKAKARIGMKNQADESDFNFVNNIVDFSLNSINK